MRFSQITVVVDPLLVAFSSRPTNTPQFEIAAAPGTAALIVDSERLAPRRASDVLVESAVQSRRNRIILELSGDTWMSSIGADCEQAGASPTRALLSALVAQSDGLYGFGRVIRPALTCAHVERTTSTTLTLLLDPFPTYDITFDEVVEVTIPASAVFSGQAIRAQPDLVIESSTPQAIIGGSLLTSGLSEGTLVTPIDLQLVVSLLGATWLEPSAWRNASNQQAVVDALRSEQMGLSSGWEAAVKSNIFPEDVQYVDGITLTISLRQAASYAISSPETLNIVLPAGVTRTVFAPLPVSPKLVITAEGGVVALNGSFLGNLDEAGLSGDLAIRLVGDAFIDSEEELTTLMRSGISSSSSEASGFNNILAPNLGVRRESDSLLVVSVPLTSAYDVLAPEVLSLSVPPNAVLSNQGARSGIGLEIKPSRGSVVLSDADSPDALYLYLDKSEEAVRSSSQRIALQLALSGDSWDDAVGLDSNASMLLIQGFTCASKQASGWNAIVRRTLDYTALELLDERTLRLTIPQSANYDISAPETVAVSIPGIALRSKSAPSLTAAGPAGIFVINASQGSSTLSGTLLEAINVASIQSPQEGTVTISLESMAFVEELGTSPEKQTILARALAARVDDVISTSIEPYGWSERRPRDCSTTHTTAFCVLEVDCHPPH